MEIAYYFVSICSDIEKHLIGTNLKYIDSGSPQTLWNEIPGKFQDMSRTFQGQFLAVDACGTHTTRPTTL